MGGIKGAVGEHDFVLQYEGTHMNTVESIPSCASPVDSK